MDVNKVKFKNVVSQMLGAFLKRQREINNLSAKGMAQKLDLTDSFYRLIETGSANLHPKLSLRLIDALPNIGIRLEALSKLFIAIQHIEPYRKDVNYICQELYNFSRRDIPLKNLFSNIIPFLKTLNDNEEEELDKLRKHLVNIKIENEVEFYLTKSYLSPRITNSENRESSHGEVFLEGIKPITQELLKLYSNLSSVHNFYFINEELKGLGSRLNYLISLDAVQFDLRPWEKKYKEEFVSLQMIITNRSRIIDYDAYDYDYLSFSQFQKLEVLFLEEENLESAKLDTLNFFKNNTDSDNSNVIANKVDVKSALDYKSDIWKDIENILSINESQVQEGKENNLANTFRKGEDKFTELLLYRCKGHIEIGFIHFNSEEKQLDFPSLSNLAVFNLFRMFEKYWGQIQ